jgi:hypothetical protein
MYYERYLNYFATMSYSSITKKKLYTEESCITAVSSDGMKLKSVTKQTEAICIAAVRNNVNALPFCEVLTSEIIEVALQRDKNALDLIPKRAGFEAWKIAVSMYPENLFKAPVLDERLCRIAVCENPQLFPKVKNMDFSVKLFVSMLRSFSWNISEPDKWASMLKQLEPKFWNLLVASNPKYFPYTPQTPQTCLAAVRYNGDFLKHVKDKTPEVCLEAVKNRYTALAYVAELTPILFITALEQAFKIQLKETFKQVSSLNKPSVEIVLACIEKYPRLISHVSSEDRMRVIQKVPKSALLLPSKDVTPKIVEAVFNSSASESNAYSPVDSLKLQEWAVNHNPLLFPKMENKNKESFMKMVKSNAWYKLSPGNKFNVMKRLDLCYSVILVKQDPKAFDYSLQTEETCLIGVRHNGLNLQYVKNKTPRICLEAVMQNHGALEWVPDPTTEMYAEAIDCCIDPKVYDRVYNLPDDRLLEVLKMNPLGMRYVNSKDKTVQFCKKDYTLCRFAYRGFLSQEFLEELAAESLEIKMYLFKFDLLKVETFEETEMLINSYGPSICNTNDLFRFVKYVTQNLTPLPEHIKASELEDPVSFAVPEVGEIGAFFSISGESRDAGEHFALTVNSIIALKRAGYICPDKKVSTYEMVLVPKLNRSVSIKELKWHRF